MAMTEYDFSGKCNKLSDLIDKLIEIQDKHGDLDVSISTNDGGLCSAGMFEVYDDCVIIG